VSSIRLEIVSEASRVVEGAQAKNVTLRLLGGVAVHLHTKAGVHPELRRPYRDIDLVTTRKQGRAAAKLLTELGYEPNERFNAMNGASRLVFYDNEHGRQIDVFVGEFKMCHQIPIADRLHLDTQTVPLAELLLTKLQIVRLNDKDLHDIWAILYEHDVSDHDDDAVNAAHVADLLATDWGLWRTSRQTVETARERLATSTLSDHDRALLDERLARLWERIEAEPKSLRWRSRSKLGERSKWYEEPEEIAHAPVARDG
jgi:Uncharacterised nucleotidyltransferase